MARWPNLFLYMHTHIRENQDECGQMWSGWTHYALLSGIEKTEERREREKIKRKKEPRLGVEQPLFSLGTCAHYSNVVF